MKLHGMSVEQKMSINRDGFLVLDAFLSSEEVDFYNQELDTAFEAFHQKGLSNPEWGKVQHVDQISAIIEHGEAFLELMEHPRMMNLLRDLLGDSFVMVDNDALLKPALTQSHTSWHRDRETITYTDEKRVPFMVKVFYFLSDINPDGGCLAFLPGSHLMTNDQLPKTQRQEDMPAHVRMAVKAGTAVIFEAGIYHSALANKSDTTRRSLIYNYGASSLRTWPGYEPSSEIKANAQTNMRKMLLGVTPWVTDPRAFENIPIRAEG